MKITIEFDTESVDIDGVRKQLSIWEDKGKYSADIRRLLWAIDTAITKEEVKDETDDSG
jgi:hypothetical protein